MASRFFAHGELPLVLLALLAERPRHGYEVMAELRRLFEPAWRPSPGTVYPALEALAAEGLLVGRADGDRTVWRPTRVGTEALDRRRPALAALEVRTGVRVQGLDSAETALARFTARVAPLAHRISVEQLADTLDDAASRLERLAARTARSNPGGTQTTRGNTG